MKQYRLKSEAVPFFVEKLATSIYGMDIWEQYGVDMVALEEVEEAFISYGIKTSESGSSLAGWLGEEKGSHFHFTINFPSMKYKEHDVFTKGKIVRELMDRIQRESNRWIMQFTNTEEN